MATLPPPPPQAYILPTYTASPLSAQGAPTPPISRSTSPSPGRKSGVVEYHDEFESPLPTPTASGYSTPVGDHSSALGGNLSAMQSYYNVTSGQISIVFLSNTAGYFVSCVSSSFLTHHLGLQWSLMVAGAFMAAGNLTLSFAPPYVAFILSLAMLGFGSGCETGLYDSCLTTVISHEEDGVLMSCMYACFGLGAMLSPLIIGAFIDRNFLWSRYYLLPLALTFLISAIAFPVFSTYKAPADEPHHALPGPADIQLASPGAGAVEGTVEGEIVHARATMSATTRMKRALGIRAVWAGFVLIVLAFGTTDTLSGWVVSYMVEEKNSPEAVSRYQLSGLWGGIALGRVILALLLGKRLGEKSFSILMLALASACLGAMWAVRNVAIDAVALVLVGFFIGPVTPKVLSTVGARVPPSLKSSVMSLTIGLGLIGSSVGPLLFGVVAGKGGLGSLPAVLIGASAIAACSWMLVPKNMRRED
ncbi:hypothetical protein MNV49_006305 [Pseudohyphozyma bogoriensis]|nr:hypothetical protein MNV49_006305 [Pseudohyphozyma bogoriensis]